MEGQLENATLYKTEGHKRIRPFTSSLLPTLDADV